MEKFTHLSLFSGIGGLDLAAEWAGFRTVGQCEWSDYPTKVLEKHWPDVPRWRDIRTLTGESFYERTGLRTVDVISGGFPRQPFSTAGKRRGKADDRYLWPEMLRVISEIRPAWVVGENVAGIVSLALDTVLSDLESIGYTCQAFIVPACAVDAPHRRDRCAIICRDTNSSFQSTLSQVQSEQNTKSCGDSYDVAHADGNGLKGAGPLPEERLYRNEVNSPVPESYDVPYANITLWNRVLGDRDAAGGTGFTDGGRWPPEPGVGRVADGVPHRVDRLRCLGNAVVPQQFFPIFNAIADIEHGLTNQQL